tara:strand:- start:25007 stop:25942 length:936 start_codon:yes stop_codon:yes gene_type:complete
MKIRIIAVYFGVLPKYFDLWLKSCSYNNDFEWLLVTDASLVEFNVPANVIHVSQTIEDFKSLANKKLVINVADFNPYKICDFRPAFGLIFDEYLSECQFWGHCDLDMLFGDLSHFITPKLLTYDKVFTVGHLTLYKNTDKVNNIFKEFGKSWKNILNDIEHFGFDEHQGVNKVWVDYASNVYVNESLIVDVDPNTFRFEFCKPWLNKSKQTFVYDSGKVYHVYVNCWGKVIKNEFMYIHFQKRKFSSFISAKLNDKFLIYVDGFVSFENYETVPDLIKCYNNLPLSIFFKEIPFKIKRFIRLIRRGRRFEH